MTQIETDCLIPLSMLKISFLEKSPYKGSYKGMRYIIQKEELDEKIILKVYTYKDLYNFENTNKDEINEKTFDFSKDAIEEVKEYLDKEVKNYI